MESCEAFSDDGENAPNVTERSRTNRKRVIKSIDLTHKNPSFYNEAPQEVYADQHTSSKLGTSGQLYYSLNTESELNS